MPSVLATQRVALRPAKECTALRACEKVALAYFLYLPCLGLIRRLSIGRLLFLASIPVVLWAVWRAQARSTGRWSEIARDWWPLGLILVGYWAMGWFATPPREVLEGDLVRMDRLLLYKGHLQALIEAAGPFFPATLETIYLLLYAIPPLCLGILYACGERSQAPAFYCFFSPAPSPPMLCCLTFPCSRRGSHFRAWTCPTTMESQRASVPGCWITWISPQVFCRAVTLRWLFHQRSG